MKPNTKPMPPATPDRTPAAIAPASAQFITAPGGAELVVLARADYEALLHRAANADTKPEPELHVVPPTPGEPQLPAAVTAAMLRGENRLAALRHWRDMGQVYLASQAGLAHELLAEVEAGRRALSADMRRRLAEALDIPAAWLG